MAHVYPSDATCTIQSENDVLDALRDGLDDTFHLYVNHRFIERGSRREGEVDFIVLHRELGLCAIEVKGGGVEMSADGKWTRRYGKRSEPLSRDPFAQARDNARQIQREIARRLNKADISQNKNLPLPWCHAVVFPFGTPGPGGFMPAMALDDNLLHARHMPALADHVTALMKATRDRNQRSCSDRVFEAIHQRALMPCFAISNMLSHQLESEARQTVALDARQSIVLDSVEENARFAVIGGAGTGKSLLAQEIARRLARSDHERVLYVCFNKWLAETAGAQFSTESDLGALRACHFHALCLDAVSVLDASTSFEKLHRAAKKRGPASVRDFWDHEVVKWLVKALDEGLMEPYDALVLDEAQDMRPSWWAPLSALVKAGGPMVVFYDPDQAIFGFEHTVPADLFRVRLTENYRNPRRVSAAVCQLTDQPLQTHPHAPEGADPSIISCNSRQEILLKVSETVADLAASGIQPHQIAILAPHTRTNNESTFRGIGEVCGYPVIDHPDEHPRGILYATITRYKGLEKDIVLLVDMDREDDPLCGRRHLYVAASRARRRLFAFGRPEHWPTDSETLNEPSDTHAIN